jgi:hypothetical protein
MLILSVYNRSKLRRPYSQDVAKMLGDTVAMVERHYLPYIEELKDAHVATNKRILEAAGAD